MAKKDKTARYEYDEWHDYGYVKINDRQYAKCTDRCCKSGGPVTRWRT